MARNPIRIAVTAGIAALLLTAAPAFAADAVPPAEATVKEPTEVEKLRTEVAEMRARLDRQEMVADNARGQLQQARDEIKLKDELLMLGRQRNAELMALGREILARYRSKGLGDVVIGSEPFVQASRVRLENLVQDYEDKLRAAGFTEATMPPSVEARMRAALDQPADTDATAPAPEPKPAD